MSPTYFDVFPIHGFELLAKAHGVPRGELFHVSVNPYTGSAVICFQNNPIAREYLDQILCSPRMRG